MRNITVIIPTLLKDENILSRLLDSLSLDNAVSQIIIINNSTRSYMYKNEKVKIISNGKNMFVNPSWNLGVKEAKTDYITLVNDDILIPNNFCSSILEKINENMGIVGFSHDDVINLRDKNNNINKMPTEAPKLSENIVLKPIKSEQHAVYYGIMMFFKKEVYRKIPSKLKVYYGDDWILYQAQKQKKINVEICGQKIYHCGSLSSVEFFNEMYKNERKIYNKYTMPFYKKILSIKETRDHYIINFIFLNISIKKFSKSS